MQRAIEMAAPDGPGMLVQRWQDNGDGSVTIVLPREVAETVLRWPLGPTVGEVRRALRDLDNPVALARASFAVGDDVPSRARSARAALEQAADVAFGASMDERELRRLLERAYFRPTGSIEALAAELHYSRRNLFRRLGIAVDRLTQALQTASHHVA